MNEWERKQIGKICDRIQQGGTPDTAIPEYWDGSIDWLTPAEMGKTEDRFVYSTIRKLSELGLQNCSANQIPINSVIISTRAPIGLLAINKVPIAFNQGCKGLIPKKSNDYDFLFYSLLKSKSALIDLGAGNTFKELSGTTLSSFEILIPDFLEQQKIAACLSSLDDLIAVHTKKLEVLEAYKKGLVQRLFPTEGETVPRLCFPEFQDDVGWKETQLKDVCQMRAGKFVSPSDIVNKGNEGLYPCFGGNGLRGFTKTYTHSGKYPLIGRQGALCGNITLVEGIFHATEHAVVCSPKTDIDVDWLYYLLQFQNLNQYATGQAQPGLSVDVLEKIPTMVSSREIEQQKIGTFLSSLDNLIAAQSTKIDVLKEHKKGLMQQLFPIVDGDEV